MQRLSLCPLITCLPFFLPRQSDFLLLVFPRSSLFALNAGPRAQIDATGRERSLALTWFHSLSLSLSLVFCPTSTRIIPRPTFACSSYAWSVSFETRRGNEVRLAAGFRTFPRVNCFIFLFFHVVFVRFVSQLSAIVHRRFFIVSRYFGGKSPSRYTYYNIAYCLCIFPKFLFIS